MSRMRRGNAVGAGAVGAAVVGYVLVLASTGPAGAHPGGSEPAPAASVSAALPEAGAFERAVHLAEASTGGVTIQAEAKNGAGVYEVELVLGNEEVDVVVDVETEQVVETDRELEEPFDD